MAKVSKQGSLVEKEVKKTNKPNKVEEKKLAKETPKKEVKKEKKVKAVEMLEPKKESFIEKIKKGEKLYHISDSEDGNFVIHKIHKGLFIIIFTILFFSGLALLSFSIITAKKADMLMDDNMQLSHNVKQLSLLNKKMQVINEKVVKENETLKNILDKLKIWHHNTVNAVEETKNSIENLEYLIKNPFAENEIAENEEVMQ